MKNLNDNNKVTFEFRNLINTLNIQIFLLIFCFSLNELSKKKKKHPTCSMKIKTKTEFYNI